MKFIIFNGSPRKKGTSFSFGRTIKNLAVDKNSAVEIVHIIEYFDKQKSFEELKSILLSAEVIGVIAPVYVDTLPYPVIWFLEKLESECVSELKGKSLFAIGQCGFPDINLCESVIGSCRCFAKALGMKWLGGLGYGGGPIINGQFLEDIGSKGKRITKGFDIAVEHMLKGKNIPKEAQEQLKPSVPKIMYRPLAILLNIRSKRLAAKQGVKDIDRKVYS